MICKHCEKEIPEDSILCPFCGAGEETEVPVEEVAVEEILNEELPAEEQTEETAEETSGEELSEDEILEEIPEKKKVSPWKIVALVVGCIVLLGVLTLAVLQGLGIELKPKANDLYVKNSYTVTDEKALGESQTVVAEMGGKKLTNSELQLYYENALNSFYAENYYYMSMLGLDLTQPMSEQVCPIDESKTWEQYFLDDALTNWQSYTLVELLTEQDGYQPDAQLQQELDQLPANIENFALESGYETLEAYMADNMSANISTEDYIRFYEIYYLCNAYLEDLYDRFYPDAAAIDAFFAENQASLEAGGIFADMGLISSVRHILVSVEGGTVNEDGSTTYSEEEWNTAYAEAERILQEWKDGEATEDSFIQLVGTYTGDAASIPTGGLYTDVCVDSSFVDGFKNWAADKTRVPGDTGIVESPYGYHIMYFVEGEDYADFLIAEEMIAQQIQLKILAAKAQFPIETNYKKIALAAIEAE